MKASASIWFGTLLVAISGASGQSPKVEPTRAPASSTAAKSEDEKAIRAAVDAFVRAFDKGDAKAIASMFTEAGEAIDTAGEAIRGRQALEAHYASRFASNPGEKIEATIELIHFLDPSLARQDGRSKLIPATSGEPATESRYTSTFVKTDGHWKLASVRELDDQAIGHHDRLKELEWLVGDWVEETSDTVILTSIHWSEDKHFLLRSFEVHLAGKPELKGTQRIGWDPLTKQIKSWVFDSRGGYGDGYWTRNGDRWTIKAVGVRPDGLTTSATQILTRVKKDRLLWRSTDRTLGGESHDEVQEFMMVRKPPEPK